MKKILGGAAAALGLVVGVVALTGFHGGCGAHPHGRDPAQLAAFVNDRVDDALDDIDATPDQRTKIHAIADRVVAAAKEAHAGQDEARAAFLAEWKADKPDRAKLHALVDARVDALRKVAHQAVDAGADAHDVLTPAQREKVTRKIERWHH
jgi:Spy/CpxP family protein refolding chaperone